MPKEKKETPKDKSSKLELEEDLPFIKPFDLSHKEEDDFTENEYYLYDDVSMESIKNILKFIKTAEKRWNNFKLEMIDILEDAKPKPLKIYINSNGGDIFAAIPLIDAITNCKIPVETYVEGMAASAASLIAIVGHKRYITKNSFMLIHELRSGVEGTYSEIINEKENCDKLMKVIKQIYLERTNGKFPVKKMERILKKDLILSSQECLDYGLIDKIL